MCAISFKLVDLWLLKISESLTVTLFYGTSTRIKSFSLNVFVCIFRKIVSLLLSLLAAKDYTWVLLDYGQSIKKARRLFDVYTVFSLEELVFDFLKPYTQWSINQHFILNDLLPFSVDTVLFPSGTLLVVFKCCKNYLKFGCRILPLSLFVM